MFTTKKRSIVLLSLLVALLMTVSLAFVSLRKASAEETPDVAITGFTKSAQNAFQKYEGETVNGKTTEAWGCAGWGGFAAQLLTEQDYDVSAIWNSGKAALTFWLYLDNADVVNAYHEMSGNWNMDISCSREYSDGAKVSYQLNAETFAEARTGWQKVIVPLVHPNEEHSMDWSKVSSFRINATACGFSSGITMKVAEFVFTTTELTKPCITGDPVVRFDQFSEVKNIVGGEITPKQMRIEELGREVTAYYPEGWGGYTTLYTLQDVTDIQKTENSAFSIWIYFGQEGSLSTANTYNFDISCGDDAGSYSDNYKYSFQMHKVFEMCKEGWNHVIFPLETAAERNNMDWTKVKFLRISANGGSPAWIGFAEFEIVQSAFTKPTVYGYVPAPVEPEKPVNQRIPCDAETGLHIDAFEEGWSDQGDHNPTSTAGFVKQGAGSWSLTGQGTANFGKTLASSFDLSEYKSISFWLYVDDVEGLKSMTDGQIELRSQGDDEHELNWSFKTVAETLHDGWNYIELLFEDGNKSAGYDETAVKYIRFYFVGLNKVVTTVFDDLHAHRDHKGTLIESFDKGWSGQVEVKTGHSAEEEWGDNLCTNFSGEGWSSNGRQKFKNNRTVDIADYDMIGLWVYIGNELTASEVADAEIELTSSGQEDRHELHFKMPAGLKVGWNNVTFRIADGEEAIEGPIDLTKVNFFGLMKTGLQRVEIYLDDLYAFESRYYEEATEPIEKLTVVNADASGAFTDTSLDTDEYMEGTGAAMSTEKKGSGTFTATFEALDTGLSLKGEKELGLALWVYLENASVVQTLSVALGSEASGFELSWNADVSALENGWNWLTFRASEATRNGGVIDLTAVKRVTVVFNGNSETPITIGFDCVRIVDSTVQGAFDEVSDKRELQPVSSVTLDNAESAWTGDGVSYTETLKKQGYGSVVLSAAEEGTVTAVKAVSGIGQTDLLVTRPKADNELGVTFWLYIANAEAVTSVVFKLGSSESDYLQWSVGNTVQGWNWIKLRASEGTSAGTFNADAIAYLALAVSGNAFSVNLDRVTLVNYTVAANLQEPSGEELSRNYLQEKIFLNCDNVDARTFGGNPVDASDMREGVACVMTSGNGYQLVAKDFALGKTDLTKDTIVLAFWIWIQDPTFYEADGVDGQVELTSGGNFDKDEIHWSITERFAACEKGWNWIVLTGETAGVDGTPDFDAFNFFRIYVNNIANSTLKLDRVTIGYIGNTALFEAPDWESELAGAGEYQGANGSGSLNAPYLGVDFSSPDEYTYTETVEYEVEVPAEGGCGASIALGSAIVLIVALGAGAVLLLRRGKENDLRKK